MVAINELTICIRKSGTQVTGIRKSGTLHTSKRQNTI